MIERTELYNGEVVCEFNSARHSYTISDKGRKPFRATPVTSVCGALNKPALVPWAINQTLDVCRGAVQPGVEYAEMYLEEVWSAAKKQSQKTKQDAANRGRDAHSRIEDSFRRLDIDEMSIGQLHPGLTWFKSVSGSPLEIERRIYSRRYRYSGTPDLLAIINGHLALVDWKTGNIYPEHRLQTAAYVKAWEEEHPDQPIEDRYLVHIGDDGVVPHYFPRSTLRKDFVAFLGLKAAFDRTQQIEKEFRRERKQQPREL